MISKISFNITKNPLKRNVLRIVRMILVDIIQCVCCYCFESSKCVHVFHVAKKKQHKRNNPTATTQTLYVYIWKQRWNIVHRYNIGSACALLTSSIKSKDKAQGWIYITIFFLFYCIYEPCLCKCKCAYCDVVIQNSGRYFSMIEIWHLWDEGWTTNKKNLSRNASFHFNRSNASNHKCKFVEILCSMFYIFRQKLLIFHHDWRQ